MLTVKEVLYIIAVGLILGLGVLGIKHIKNWYDTKDRLETVTAIGETTSGMVTDGAKASEDRSAVDYSVGQGRGAFNQSYEGAKRDEPEVATRATRVVPSRVRNAFRERRLARERSGCAGAECERGSEADGSSER